MGSPGACPQTLPFRISFHSSCEDDQSIVDAEIRESIMIGDVPDRIAVINEDVGLVLFVIPALEIDMFVIQMRHADQLSFRLQQPMQQPEFRVRITEVLHNFTAHDVVIGFPEKRRVVGEKRVVLTDGIALPFEDLGYHGPRSRAEIEAAMIGPEMGEHMPGDRGDEFPEIFVMDIVVVLFVSFPLLLRSRILRFVSIEARAAAAGKKIISEKGFSGLFAERTIHVRTIIGGGPDGVKCDP